MTRLGRLDNPSPIVRAIERWKRGLAVMAAFGILSLSAALPAALIGFVAGILGGDETLIGTIAFIVFAPWMMGNRQAIRLIGEISKPRDS